MEQIMGNDNHQHGSAGTFVAIVAVIVVLLLGGLVLLGVGALFWVRTDARQAEVVARMEVERAVVEMEKAEKLATRVKVKESAKVESKEASTRELTIEIDRDGAITVDGESTNLDGLRTRIQKVGTNGGVRLAVQLKADPCCLARHVVAVQSVCSEQGVEDVRMSTLVEPSSATTDEVVSPTEAAESK